MQSHPAGILWYRLDIEHEGMANWKKVVLHHAKKITLAFCSPSFVFTAASCIIYLLDCPLLQGVYDIYYQNIMHISSLHISVRNESYNNEGVFVCINMQYSATVEKFSRSSILAKEADWRL